MAHWTESQTWTTTDKPQPETVTAAELIARYEAHLRKHRVSPCCATFDFRGPDDRVWRRNRSVPVTA